MRDTQFRAEFDEAWDLSVALKRAGHSSPLLDSFVRIVRESRESGTGTREGALITFVGQLLKQEQNRLDAPSPGDRVTNGKITVAVVHVDDTGVMLDNGYCPNREEFRLQWRKVDD